MPANFQIVLKSGPTSGTAFLLEKNELFIGRDLGNDIVINDPEVSRRHARLYLQNNYYVIEDMGSTNGSSVNGQRLTAPYLLRPGEMITFGERVNLTFETAPQPEIQIPEVISQTPYPAPPISQPGYYTSAQPAAVQPPPAPVYPPPQAPVYPPPQAQPPQAPVYSLPPLQAQFDPMAAYQPPAQLPVSQLAASPYAGQIPNQPYQEPEIRYRIPIWIFIILGVMAIIILILLIDDFRLWCPLLGMGC